MTDFTSNTEIQEILERFACFLNIYETLSDKCTDEEVTESFKAAKFIENVVKEFESRSILTQFITCLNAWLRLKHRTLYYDAEFYKESCDHLLLKYLLNNNKNNVEFSIEMYTSCCEKKRFQSVLEKSFKKTHLYEPIVKYISVNKNNIDLIELKSKLLSFQWKFEISCGRRDKVLIIVRNMLSSYSVNKQLPYLIKVLILQEDSQLEALICEELSNKMDDRNIMSKEFWTTLTQLNQCDLLQICCLYEIFLDKFISFLIYCGFMMDRKLQHSKLVWVTSTKSICPDITHDNLTELFIHLVDCNEEISNNVKLRINDCMKNSDNLFWSDMLDVLF